MSYDNSPRKKYSELILPTEAPKSPTHKSLEAPGKLENTLTEESVHVRQESYPSGLSGQDSDEYDSDSLERFGSGWDTLYHMRSSFRSKLKEKESLSKSVEPRPSLIENLREVCDLYFYI